MNSKTILIAGGTGLVGTRLSTLLVEKGHAVRLLTRTPKGENQFVWDPAQGTIDERALEGVDAVINLAGAGIADKRWTPERKRLLIDSRVQSADTLREALKHVEQTPGIYVSASAIGYYGNSGEKRMDERDAPVEDTFMVNCCQQWEGAAEKVGAMGLRTVIFRIGIVLAKDGGALPEVERPLKFGIGSYFADGQAWWSWIHIDDLCRMFLWAMENENVEGVYNAVAPFPERNLDLVKKMAQAMDRRVLYIPAPAFALRTALGEMSAVILNSNLVSGDKIMTEGFVFRHPKAEEALEEISKQV